MSAAALRAEARAAGVGLRLVDGKAKVSGTPSPELLARLRAAKPELIELLLAAPTAARHHWPADRSWCARIGALPTVAARREVLRDWTDAAGGWSDAGAIHLPHELPNRLALARLKAHARALSMAVHIDPDEPTHLRWLRGEPLP